MVPSDPPLSEQAWTRRQFFIGAGGAALIGGVGQAGASTEKITPTMVIPTVDEFENNYTGQFLTVLGRDSEEGDPGAVHDACEEVPWPEGETEVNRGQLTDRQSDEPIAVRLPVFVDGRRQPISEDTMFMISNASTCQGDYVTVQTTSIRLRSVRGEPPGPEVSETDTETFGAGFGLAAGSVGASVALLVQWLRGKE